MKKTFLLSFLALTTFAVFAQKKTTTSATVLFDATTSLDKAPKAENKTVIAAVDTKTGAVQFEVNVKNFAFANPTMQGHFNGANWMNSDTYPSFTFSGMIVNLANVNFEKNGTYTAQVEGGLTIRGKEQKLKVPATVIVQDGTITANSDFTIALADFGISGNPIDAGKVAKEPKVSVSAQFK
ncbi:MAG: YceI family protein [Chitinophagaceae bacterium]